MITSLLDSLKESVSSELIEKANVSPDSVPSIMEVIGNTTQDQLGKQVTSGNLGSLMNLFSSGTNNDEADSIQSNLMSGVVSGLADKLGFDPSKAQMIASIAVPKLIEMITSKNEETPSDDASPLTNLFGGSAGGIMDKAKGLFS